MLDVSRAPPKRRRVYHKERFEVITLPPAPSAAGIRRSFGTAPPHAPLWTRRANPRALPPAGAFHPEKHPRPSLPPWPAIREAFPARTWSLSRHSLRPFPDRPTGRAAHVRRETRSGFVRR